MHFKSFIFFFFAVVLTTAIQAQEKVIPLYSGAVPGSENWNWQEAENNNNAWNTKVVYNVSRPSLTVFQPDASVVSGTAVIVCPGGAFHALSINNEGNDIARWLAKKGITAFVLRYRLVRSLTNDPVKEVAAKMGKKEFEEQTATLIPLAIADGREAIKYVRQHATEYGIAPNRIGIIGFSAGGTVTASTAYNYTLENRPDFVAPIYAFMPANLQKELPADAPPLFVAAATDDQLRLAPHSVDLYQKWVAAKHPAELHLYAKGGHGFGMRVQNLPSDSWIERFGDWLGQQGFLKPAQGSQASAPTTPAQQDERRKREEEQLRTDWANLKRYAEDNKRWKSQPNNGKRVVFMGNSITEGWLRADSSFFAGRQYIDRGISGQTTPQMLVRFRPDVIDLKPAVVVILAGINDIAQNTGPIPLETTFGNIVSMAELAKRSGIRVIISSVLPAYDFPWRPGLQPAEKVVQLNTMLKNYAAKNGIIYLDYFTSMADERKGLKAALTYDGVHPTLAGYKVMEPLAEKAIAQALKQK